MTHGVLTAAGIGAATAAGFSPYLARLTRSVPDRGERHWWRGRTAGSRRTAVTAATALVLGGLGGASVGLSVALPAFIVLAVLMTPLAVIDVEHHRLPDRLTFLAAGAAAVLLALAAAIHHDRSAAIRVVVSAVAVFLVFYAMAIASPKSFGGGDVKLGAVLAAHLGWLGWLDVWYGIFAGFLVTTIVALPLLATGRATRKTALPFGPGLMFGALAVAAFRLVPG